MEVAQVVEQNEMVSMAQGSNPIRSWPLAISLFPKDDKWGVNGFHVLISGINLIKNTSACVNKLGNSSIVSWSRLNI